MVRLVLTVTVTAADGADRARRRRREIFILQTAWMCVVAPRAAVGASGPRDWIRQQVKVS